MNYIEKLFLIIDFNSYVEEYKRVKLLYANSYMQSFDSIENQLQMYSLYALTRTYISLFDAVLHINLEWN